MAALTVQIEWERADGVTHPLFAETWARIEISIGARCVTTVHDVGAGGTRTGVYGPAFLLAEWIVRNFWFLLWECAPARDAGRGWLRRHALAAAREGTSLPDLTLFRDEERLVAEWRADDLNGNAPVTFVSSGREELDPGNVRTALSNVVELVLDRLRGVDHPDALALRADWNAIATASGDEARLCKRAARLGLDAYDPGEVTDDVESVLVGAIDALPEPTLGDVLDAGVGAAHLRSTVAAVRSVVNGTAAPRLRGGARDLAGPSLPADWPAHAVGYAFARDLRRRTLEAGTVPLDEKALLASLGMRNFYQPDPTLAQASPHANALVGFSQAGVPQLIAAPRKRLAHDRFLVARGLFAVAIGAIAKAPRALTLAGTRLQAASRAFAAELLAPAEALRTRLADGYDDDRLDDLAEEFGVASAVIEHQIENHGLTAMR